MVLAKVRIRDDLVADISDARPRLRIVLGETEKVKLVSKDDQVEIEAPDGQRYVVSAQALVTIWCLKCREPTFVKYNTRRCGYCGETDEAFVRPLWDGEPTPSLVRSK